MKRGMMSPIICTPEVGREGGAPTSVFLGGGKRGLGRVRGWEGECVGVGLAGGGLSESAELGVDNTIGGSLWWLLTASLIR